IQNRKCQPQHGTANTWSGAIRESFVSVLFVLFGPPFKEIRTSGSLDDWKLFPCLDKGLNHSVIVATALVQNRVNLRQAWQDIAHGGLRYCSRSLTVYL